MSSFDLSKHPIVFLRPRLAFPYSWAGHIPFAYLLMDILRPRRFVELGTDSGNSYLAFCQAVSSLGIDVECTAIDSWEGDAHARYYGDDVYRALRAYHDPRYSSFSTLYRSYFDEAVKNFADGSIDLLHIDGLHTYEAVRHDFDTWLPKLSSRAVVIFHDTHVRERDFGVWKLFEELGGRYPAIEFHHSNGLGVVQTGPEAPAAFREFVELFRAQPDVIRTYFAAIAATILNEDEAPCGGVDAVIPDVIVRLYYRRSNETFTDDRMVSCAVGAAVGTMEARFELPEGVRPDFIRIDPADFPGVYAFEHISMRLKRGERDRGQPLSNPRERIRAVSGDLLPGNDDEPLRLVALEPDPYIEFNVADVFADAEMRDSPMVFARLSFVTVLDEPDQQAALRVQAEAIATLKSKFAQDARASSGLSGQIENAGASNHVHDIAQIYWQSGDEPFDELRSVSLGHGGLSGLSRLTFRLPAGVRADSVRFDPSRLSGQFEIAGLRINGRPFDDLGARVLKVHQHCLASGCSGSLRWAAFDGDAQLVLDVRDCPPAAGEAFVIELICRREDSAIQQRRLIDATVTLSTVSAVEALPATTASIVDKIRREYTEQVCAMDARLREVGTAVGTAIEELAGRHAEQLRILDEHQTQHVDTVRQQLTHLQNDLNTLAEEQRRTLIQKLKRKLARKR
jgi:hypothetical protein